MSAGFVVAAIAVLLFPLAARADCQVTEFLDLPIAVTNMHPLVEAEIEGVPARFIVDSGASFNSITSGAAKAFHLDLEPGPVATAEGVGGDALMSLATVKVFTLAHYPFKKVPFLVGGGEIGDDAAGLLGQELLGVADVDYDFSNGFIRFMRPKDCGGQPLAYWLKPGQTFGELDFSSSDPDSKDIVGTATVNGVKIKVLFDTGGGDSLLSPAAAKRAGISLNDAGVVDGGSAGGIGSREIRTWIAPVESFEIGGEQILHTRLRIGEWANKYQTNPDMILGDDFFLSHRVFVANSQHKIYFTYNGGPVFNLDLKGAATASNGQPPPTTAGGWASLGAAELSRRAWREAVTDLGHAIDLDQGDAQTFYRRGLAYSRDGQTAPAVKDLDSAVKLRPDYPEALMLRGRLKADAGDLPGAQADLALADKALGKDSDYRLELGSDFDAAGQPHLSLVSIDDWIEIHPDDGRMAYALADRCRIKAMANEGLDAALGDCQRSLRLAPGVGLAVEARGLVFLRQGVFDKAIADETAVLASSPDCAWCLEARGVARVRNGQTAEGKADLAAAAALNDRMPQRAKDYGFTP